MRQIAALKRAGLTLAGLALTVCLGSCSSARPSLGPATPGAPQLGALIPATADVVGMVHKGRLLCAHEDRASGVVYQFDIACRTSRVVYVKTEDPRFRSPEGLAIGDALARAAATPGASLRLVGSYCGVALPSGWVARPEARIAVENEEACAKILSESISYFNTRRLDP
jgi:hypothetical protein